MTYCRRTLDTLDEGVAQMARKFKDEYEGCNVDFEFHGNGTGELIKGLMKLKQDIIFCSETAGGLMPWSKCFYIPYKITPSAALIRIITIGESFL